MPKGRTASTNIEKGLGLGAQLVDILVHQLAYDGANTRDPTLTGRPELRHGAEYRVLLRGDYDCGGQPAFLGAAGLCLGGNVFGVETFAFRHYNILLIALLSAEQNAPGG